MASQLELIVRSRERDIGGFSVRRLLPYATHRMVGPFIFFDHMGPANFAPGQGIDVRPHPHMNLATVTYLFEGQMRHRDSLGSDQIISPGDINWMIAGRGIVHSERTPGDVRARGGPLHGIQCWVAFPRDYEEIEPAFTHHPKNTLPEFEAGGVKLKLLLGTAFGRRSPVTTHMDIFYLEAKLGRGSKLVIPDDGREAAVHVVSGRLSVGGEPVAAQELAIGSDGSALELEALEDTHAMLLGGQAVGQRFIYWNLVSSSQERIEEAKRDWARGPGAPGGRFPLIPGDDKEFIPLPENALHNPKGTIM
ncbi:MAG TPA: pirin family protein [Bdellovibrionales bacterium]|nr:pirin family protein [Bdellovibrionales bacterium]